MKILVVDDEMDVRFLFEQQFRKEIRSGDMEFNFALSGENALTYLQEHGHEAVLILSDINMPGMNGLELLRIIKQTFDSPSPHVIMITAYGDQENYSQAINFGADDLLTKPVDFTFLRQKLKSVV